MKRSSKLILLLLLFCQAAVFAQNITVTGKVTTPLSEPISGVTIKVAGSKQGTTSGETGNFSINVSSKATLQFSHVSYGAQSIPLNGRTSLTVILKPNEDSLQAVVVTAL